MVSVQLLRCQETMAITGLRLGRLCVHAAESSHWPSKIECDGVCCICTHLPHLRVVSLKSHSILAVDAMSTWHLCCCTSVRILWSLQLMTSGCQFWSQCQFTSQGYVVPSEKQIAAAFVQYVLIAHRCWFAIGDASSRLFDWSEGLQTH